MKKYTVLLSKNAGKELKRLPGPDANRVFKAIAKLGDNPRPNGCKKLKDFDDSWRIRKGNYRVIYTIDDDRIIVDVITIGHRKDVYR